MKLESIIDRYNTTFGMVIILSTEHAYRTGDLIFTNEGEFKVKQVIMPTRPAEENLVSFVVD